MGPGRTQRDFELQVQRPSAMLFVTKNPLKVLQAFNPQPYGREEKTSWPLWVRGQLGVLLGSSSQGYYLGKIIITNFFKKKICQRIFCLLRVEDPDVKMCGAGH